MKLAFIYLFATIALTTSCLICNAQEIKGTVVSLKDGSPLEGAVVTLSRDGGRILTFRQTGKDGSFYIQLEASSTDTLQIDVRLMGYKTISMRQPFPDNITVRMEEERFEIPEVTVKAEKMEVTGDTISYYVPTMLEKGDLVLGDVLSRITGVSVSRDGYVQYMGRSISHMYIDSTDLLESRYNLATNNIDPRDIKSIEIYENHQHIKALRGIVTPDRAAINIILKDDAKAKWIITLGAAAGGSAESPRIPYNANIFAMNIGGKMQSFNLAETDASGENIAVSLNPSIMSIMQEDMSFRDEYNPASYLYVNHTRAPLDDSRTRFNTTYAASSNNKFKAAGTVFGISGKFEHETLNSESTVRNIYNNGDGTVTDFTEINTVGTTEYYGSADLSAEINSSKVYLNEKLRIELEGSDAAGSLNGTSLRDQTAGNRDMNIMNRLELTEPGKNGAYLFLNMLTQYRYRDEGASVMSPSDSSTATQDISGRYFFNTISLDYAFRIGKKFTLNTRTWIDYLYRSFRTSLNGLNLKDASQTPITDNDLILQYIKPREDLFLRLTHGKFYADIAVDMWYQYIHCRMHEQMNGHNLSVNPYVSLGYKFGPRFSIRAVGRYNISGVNEQQIYDGLIMTNYKYLSQGRTELTQTPQWAADIYMKLNEPISGWAVTASAGYNSSKSFQSTRYFIDDYIVNILSNDVTDYWSVHANASVSKTFISSGTKITADFGFSNTSSTLNQNGTDFLYCGRNYSTALEVISSVSDWMGIRYKGSYGFSRYSTDGQWTSSGNHSSTQHLTLAFYPHESIELSAEAEYYADKADSRNLMQTFFLDASVSWSTTDKLRIYLQARNLLDNREYAYSVLLPLQTSYYEYSIRPLNVLIGIVFRF